MTLASQSSSAGAHILASPVNRKRRTVNRYDRLSGGLVALDKELLNGRID